MADNRDDGGADYELLGSLSIPPFLDTAARRVHGHGAEEMLFSTTRNELLQLAKYWGTEIVKIDFFRFQSGNSSASAGEEVGQFAEQRLNSIAEIVGSNLVDLAVAQADQEFAQTLDARSWETFLFAASHPCDPPPLLMD